MLILDGALSGLYVVYCSIHRRGYTYHQSLLHSMRPLKNG
ncbi:hypothetical protein HMPREF1989_01350 [Porphyromonas gingivalis F0566]|nr:hypothetical protein HMPREF1989_01350 [Porphyromonas gingivalis F0566]